MPKRFWLMNYIEIFNEFVFQLATIHIVIFTAYVPNQEIQYNFGFSMVGTMSVLILVNIFFVMWFGGVTIYLYIVKYYRRVVRYFDPDFMREPPAPVLTGNLPLVFEPFNAMK